MNEDLSKMMDMSKKDLLRDDGLSTLEYTKVDFKEYPLYTWVLAKLPQGIFHILLKVSLIYCLSFCISAPPKDSPGWINGLGHSLWNGMSFAADGLAKKVSDTAVEMAAKNEENEESKKNHIY